MPDARAPTLHYRRGDRGDRLFRRRELSPVELLDAVRGPHRRRSRPSVNALTEQLLDEAYAARASRRRATPGRRLGRGRSRACPLLLKEEQPIAGRTIEEGSLLEKGNVADVTHPVVERVFEAGAVVHGRTTTPEFSCAPFTHSDLWGVTRNPWNTELTPGGSSGGSGCGAGRRRDHPRHRLRHRRLDPASPSSLCGVVGFKPPFGRVPGMAPFNSDTYCADGPMGRSVADVALLQNVLAGPHPHDQASLRPAYVLPDQLDDVRGLRVALCDQPRRLPRRPRGRGQHPAAAAALEAAGAIVDGGRAAVDPRAAQRRAPGRTSAAIFGRRSASSRGEHGRPADALHAASSPAGRPRRSASRRPTPPGWSRRPRSTRRSERLLERNDVLLCPTVAAQGLRRAVRTTSSRHVRIGDTEVPLDRRHDDAAVQRDRPRAGAGGARPVVRRPVCRPASSSSGAPTTTQRSSALGAALEAALGFWSGSRPGGRAVIGVDGS